MIIFDEKRYAEEILKDGYKTKKHQGRERCIIARYLRDQGKDDNYIKEKIDSLYFEGKEYLTKDNLDMIYSRILEKANNYAYVFDITVDIYKEEMDIIINIQDEKAKNLLFVSLVYYKWASQVFHLRYNSYKRNCIMVIENDNELFKLAGISKLKVQDRYKVFNYIYKNKLYITDTIKSTNYFFIPFAKNEGEVVLSINNYDNILGWLNYYLNPKEYRICIVCGKVFKPNNNKQKYCKKCASFIKKNQTKESMQKIRNEDKQKCEKIENT